MGVVTQHWESVLAGEGGNPDVVERDGLNCPFQFQTDLGIASGRHWGNGGDFDQREIAAEPVLLAGTVARLAIPK